MNANEYREGPEPGGLIAIEFYQEEFVRIHEIRVSNIRVHSRSFVVSIRD